MADLKTEAIVLKRTNFNESDRIISFLTPEGRFLAIAKGARKEKSKLAGGIELFSLSKIVLHQRETNLKNLEKEAFGILTSARSIEFYHQILADLETLELASSFLKQINQVARQVSSAELFLLLKQTLHFLNQHSHSGAKKQVIRIYFKLNLSRVCGEELNVFFDRDNQKLSATATYDWDEFDKVFIKRPDQSGQIDQNVIKLLRLMLTAQLSVILNIKHLEVHLPIISRIIQHL